MHLQQLQHDFIKAIFEKNDSKAQTHVTGDNRLSAKQRLGIYRGSVHGILTNALGETFPVIKALVGEKFFDHMCDPFIDQYPPNNPYFSKYGEDLSLFLKHFEPTKSIPYLADVADLEWARHSVWHEHNKEPADLSKMANLTEEQQATVSFELKQSLRLLKSDYRIDLIWFAHQSDSEIILEEVNVDKKTLLLIYKGVDGIKISEFDAENKNESNYWNFLTSISAQNNITQLAEQFGEQLPVLLNRCIQEGLIQSFKTS